MSERIQTTFSRRTSAKRRITHIAKQFDQGKGDVSARQTVANLREDVVGALDNVRLINIQLLPLLDTAEVNGTDRPTSSTVSGDIADSDEYVTKAEDIIFEASRYHEIHLAPSLSPTPSPLASAAAD